MLMCLNTLIRVADFVYHTEMFDRLTFIFPSGDQGYFTSNIRPSKRQVSEWQTFEITNDATFDMTQSQTIPADAGNWQRGTTHDGSGASYGGGQLLARPCPGWCRFLCVRIRWHGDETGGRPWLQDIKLKESFAVILPNSQMPRP